MKRISPPRVCVATLFIQFWLLFLSAPLQASSLPAEPRQFLENYCTDCHDSSTHKAGLNLEALSFDLQTKSNAALWESVFDKLDHGQMPPKKADQPTLNDRHPFQSWLGGELRRASLVHQQQHGRVPFRRLTRIEYENTLRDLLHVETDLKDLFPEDATTAGFQKVSEGLSLSSVHFARYQEAADKALSDVIPTKPFSALKVDMDGAKIMKGNPKTFTDMGCWLNGDAFVMPSNLFYPYTAVRLQRSPRGGRYRFHVTASGLHTQGRPLPIAFNILRDSSLPDAPDAAAWYDLPAEEPITITTELSLKSGESFAVFGWTLPHRDVVNNKRKKLGIPPEEWTESSLAIYRIKAEGPLALDGTVDTWPPQNYRELFGETPLRPLSETLPGAVLGSATPPANKRSDSDWAADPLVPFSDSPKQDAEMLIRRFVSKAFRRPVSAQEQQPYVERVLHALDKGAPFHEAMKSGFMAVICSPHVLFLNEAPGRLDTFALASRLSYFLWNAPPDSILLELAQSGSLTDPRALYAQVERLLSDSRASRFEANFIAQWLDLNKITATSPDDKLYPEFDRILQESALKETERFFHEILLHDGSILEFVHSDWTFLNERLARHYNLPDVQGFELQKVFLPSQSHRGGVMTHASVLKVTADGAKTSPILRGKWICERILGITPSPPPEDVKKIEPDIRGATTIRAQLEKHRSSEACASCHAIMDPPGFALESFDVIGGWREFYRTPEQKPEKIQIPNTKFNVSRGLAVEEGYVLADGRRFANVDEYKKLLLSDPDTITRNLASKLLTYATGAPVQFADRELIDAIVQDLHSRNYGLRTLVHQIVQSRPFLNK